MLSSARSSTIASKSLEAAQLTGMSSTYTGTKPGTALPSESSGSSTGVTPGTVASTTTTEGGSSTDVTPGTTSTAPSAEDGISSTGRHPEL